MKTKLEIIEETASFYNSTNTAFDKGGTCQYITLDGKMCGVGRCMTPDVVGLIRGSIHRLKGRMDENPITFDQSLFKEEYRGHDMSFWRSIQEFHDDIENWDKNGLTEYGLRTLQYLTDQYKDEN